MEKIAGCFTLIVFLMSFDCFLSVALPRGAVHCVIVLFPDHTIFRLCLYGIMDLKSYVH